MTLKECYQILGLSQTASLEDIKHAYRTKAFELHPDLNPKLKDAGLQFQKLNEAYVILSKLIAIREAKEKKVSPKPEPKPEPKQAPKPEPKPESKPEPEPKAKEPEPEPTKTEQTKKTDDPKDSMYAEQGEVLQEILNDPFARRVFEDIYSAIRKNAPPKAPQQPEPTKVVPPKPTKREPLKPAKPEKTTPSKLGLFERRFKLDFSKGVGGALKGWLRSQIDEEQVFELPAKKLIPGSRIRLQIRHGFSDELTTIDVILPLNFSSDKPIRLKGMGKKLGSWQGDLYLKLVPRR